ncbi:hypothetical protein HA402_012983 [Bradysia odoriphaga]|nr:hypothetical protein HA402_012983 [Bradysia odoriphaga]
MQSILAAARNFNKIGSGIIWYKNHSSQINNFWQRSANNSITVRFHTPVNVDVGYEKANSSNLPMVSIQMLAEFFNRTTMYVNNESSGIQANRSLGHKYGDETIGRVQVKHSSVIAAVTPENKINNQPYKVVVNIDLHNQKIKTAECKGCIAALGGCKHAIALIGWLHRRSEEPSPTEQICYWKKSILSSVDTSKPYHTDTE